MGVGGWGGGVSVAVVSLSRERVGRGKLIRFWSRKEKVVNFLSEKLKDFEFLLKDFGAHTQALITTQKEKPRAFSFLVRLVGCFRKGD